MEWTGQVYADTPTVAGEIYVEAPPERVWALVSDIYLMPGLSAHPELGEWETVSTIVACEEPRCFAWAVGDPDHPSTTWRFTLRPDGPGTVLEQWAQMGPGRSGLNLAIDAMPEKEQKIVFVRLREMEAGLTGNLAAIKKLAEQAL